MPRIALAGNNLAAAYVLDLALGVLTPSDVLTLAPAAPQPSWQVSLGAHARERGVKCLRPVNVNDPAVVAAVEAHEPDLFLSVYYTQIFRGDLMGVIAGRAVNFHPSLLPRHRGTAPLIWAIAEGDRTTGLTVHHIDEGLDTGRIIKQYSLPIHREDTGYSLHRKMAHLVGATAAELLRDLCSGVGLTEGAEQRGEASLHNARDPRLNRIEWGDTRERIRNVVRALAPPLPGAYVTVDNSSLVIARVDPVDPRPGAPARPPGMVDVRDGRTPAIWASDGPLLLTSVVVDGALTPGSTLVEIGTLREGTVVS